MFCYKLSDYGDVISFVGAGLKAGQFVLEVGYKAGKEKAIMMHLLVGVWFVIILGKV